MADEFDNATERRKSRVEWKTDKMQTACANVVNIQGTREQIELFYGISHGLGLETGETPLQVDVSNRMILTPYAAKRMHQLLTGVLREYESRHGTLKVEDT